jgi:hypothetical protein
LAALSEALDAKRCCIPLLYGARPKLAVIIRPAVTFACAGRIGYPFHPARMRHDRASRATLLRRRLTTSYRPRVSSPRREGPTIGTVSLDGYRRQGPRAGGVLAMAPGGAPGCYRRIGRRDL